MAGAAGGECLIAAGSMIVSPRKTRSMTSKDPDKAAANVDLSVRAKKPGPRKVPSKAAQPKAVGVDSSTGPKKRGRPRKLATEASAKKRGGPRKVAIESSYEVVKAEAASTDSGEGAQPKAADVGPSLKPQEGGRPWEPEIEGCHEAFQAEAVREDCEVGHFEAARKETDRGHPEAGYMVHLPTPRKPGTPMKLASSDEAVQPSTEITVHPDQGHPEAANLDSSATPRKHGRSKDSDEPEGGPGLPVKPCSPRRTRSMANKGPEAAILNIAGPASPERLTVEDNEKAMQRDDDSDDDCVRVIPSIRRTDANVAAMQRDDDSDDECVRVIRCSSANVAANCEEGCQFASLPECLNGEPTECSQWRAQAFADVWTRLEEHIQNAQEEQNKSIFDTIQHWIWTTYSSAEQSRLYAFRASAAGEDFMPSAEGVQNKQLNTGLLLLGGVDPSDQSGTFDELAAQLKSAECHVAALTPSDFLCRGGVVGPLRSLLKQFVSIDPDTTDLEILAAWYGEAANQGHPLVVLVESAESSRSEVLAELIVALSEWIGQIPIFLVMGLATTVDSLRKSLPANAMDRLKSCKFALRSPSERLEAVISDALVSSFCGFEVGHSVAGFMESYFTTHDLTLSFLIRSLKVACIEHFSREPLSFLCSKLLNARSKAAFEEDCLNLPDVLLQYASAFQSIKSMRDSDTDGRQISGMEIATLLWEFREHKKRWCMALQCLHQAGKHAGCSFVGLFCKALHPSPSQFLDVISSVRNLPRSTLSDLLDEWKTETAHEKELNLELVALKAKLEAGVPCEPKDARPAPQAGMNKKQLKSLQLSLMKQMNLAAQNSEAKSVGTLAAEFLQQIVECAHQLQMCRKFLVPLETLPLHEVLCFKSEHLIKQALSGEIRRRVHFDLVHSQTCLQCDCCSSGKSYGPTSPDACLGYCLAEEHNDHINVHDWYQSFATVLSSCDSAQASPFKKQGKGRSRKKAAPVAPGSKAIIQARFSKAAAELQLLGLVRFPKKKRPDYIQRSAFGF